MIIFGHGEREEEARDLGPGLVSCLSTNVVTNRLIP
jgi:hypothetical protein